MNLKTLIEAIVKKHQHDGIDVNAPATSAAIQKFETHTGITLPADFRNFYNIANGFGCNEDIFNMTSLEDITEHADNYGDNWFSFAEYMIYSDSWAIRLVYTGSYEIFNTSYPLKAMTNSLYEFLEHFLQGNVFDPGGLYPWQGELSIGPPLEN